jgi:hypothetical protein
MGQTRPVQVYLLVTVDTIEERLLGLLGAKSALSLAALDLSSEEDEVEMSCGLDELKRRLEILLGRPEPAPPEPEIPAPSQEEEKALRQRHVSEAGGRLLTAAFDFLSELLPQNEKEASPERVASLNSVLSECLERDEEGRPRLVVTLPDEGALQRFTEALSRAMG